MKKIIKALKNLFKSKSKPVIKRTIPEILENLVIQADKEENS